MLLSTCTYLFKPFALCPPPPSPPTCRYGDLEAIEDYMAIGKGALADSEQRTALHYAVAYDKPDALQVRA